MRIEPSARASLDEPIAAQVAEVPADARRALIVLGAIEPSIEWEPFVGAAVHRLREYAPSQGRPPQTTATDSRWLLHILWTAGQAAAQERAARVDEGVALEYVWLANEQGAAAAALGDWLYEELRQSSPESWATRSYAGHAGLGKNLVDALLADPATQPVSPLAQAIERVGDFNVIASMGAYAEGEALASALVAELSESKRFTAALNGDRFRALWPHIARAGSSDTLDRHALVRTVCAHATFATELAAGSFAEDRMDMYAAVLTAHPDPSAAASFAEWVTKELSSLRLEQWRTAMADSDDWAALLAAVHYAAPAGASEARTPKRSRGSSNRSPPGAKSRASRPSSGGTRLFHWSGLRWRVPISRV